MWETLLDQEILPLTATNTDMETSLTCPETSSQANLGQEFFLFDCGEDIQNTIIQDVTSDCTEDLLPLVADASVFQNLEYIISDCENTKVHSLMEESGIPAENQSTIPGEVSAPSLVSEKQIMELQQQDKDLMEFLSLSGVQLDHCEEFHDLNLLLGQVAAHDEVLESLPVSTKDVIVPTVCGDNSDNTVVNAPSEQQITGDSSSEPPRKKQKRISATVNENSDEVSSTANEKLNLSPKTTHQKYMEMRRKNNIASRRSRQIRKEKDKALDVTVVELENENKVLKQRAEQLEKQRDALKNYLMDLIARPSSKV